MTGAGVLTVGEGLAVLGALDSGPLELRSSLSFTTGGAEGNVAIGLSRLGTPVTWVGRVGDDQIGRRVVRELCAEGVDVRAILAPEPTGLLVKERLAGGRTSVSYYRRGSAGSGLSPDDLTDVDPADYALVHVTGITPALSHSARNAILALAERTRAAGVALSFDVNHRSSLWLPADAAPVYRSLIALSDVVFAGADEAALVLGLSDAGPDELAAGIAALGPGEVVIKLGADGCFAWCDGEIHREPAIRVEVVDTVGAGDAFVAGWLAERIAGESVAGRARTAVAVAAAQCLVAGDWEGLPRRAELDSPADGDPVRR
ncbi:MAG: sugar kinase [Microbacterium sp.]